MSQVNMSQKNFEIIFAEFKGNQFIYLPVTNQPRSTLFNENYLVHFFV